MTAEPVIVTDVAAATSAARRLARQGWHRSELTELPAQPWDLGAHRLFSSYDTTDVAHVQQAMLAAVRGVRLIVFAAPADTLASAGFLDDLSRIAPPSTAAAEPTSDRDALLGLLADGLTVTSAAQAMHVSRRTANRWLAAALTEYGVDSTAAAVRAFTDRSRSGS